MNFGLIMLGLSVMWIAGSFSDLVKHIRTHGLERDPELHKQWDEGLQRRVAKRRAKSQRRA